MAGVIVVVVAPAIRGDFYMKGILFYIFLSNSRYAYTVFIFCFLSFSGLAQKVVPELWGHRIHDEANVLLPKNIDYLESRLKAYEDSASNQIAILVIPSLEGENLEAYSLRVAEAWKLGQEKKDNGLLILVAVDDHKIRFEVGQGLEGVLTDALCSRIIRNKMAPEFRRNNYAAGLNDALDVVILSIAGEYVEENKGAGGESFFTKHKVLLIILVGLLFMIPTIYAFIKELSRPAALPSNSASTLSESSSDWSVSSSSSSSSSSSDDSSFSGGGGSFGGGGASGSW